MNLNLKRGLLRTWIVASLLWVVTVCVVGWGELMTIFVAVEPQEGTGAVTLPLGDYACWATRHTDNIFALMTDDPKYPKTLMEARLMCVKHKARIPGIALLVPLAVLTLGYLVGWIVNGFKRA